MPPYALICRGIPCLVSVVAEPRQRARNGHLRFLSGYRPALRARVVFGSPFSSTGGIPGAAVKASIPAI